MYRPLGDMPTDATFVDPSINTPQPDPLASLLTSAQNAAIRQLPSDFPNVLAQAKRDFYTFKAGVDSGFFPPGSDFQTVNEWFADFPRYWEAIRPNYVPDYSTVVSAHQAALLDEADAFVATLTNTQISNKNLGIGPLIIAGILVAAVAGVAGVIWAIGYVKAQNNISSIITQTVAGKLPPEILAQIERDAGSSPGPLESIGSILKWGAIGLVAVLIVPPVINLLTARRSARA